MRFLQTRPTPALRPYVRRFWMLADAFRSGERALERVVPDGRMELVVHLGDPFTRLDGTAGGERQARAVLAGQLHAPLHVRPGARIDLFAIGFEPWGAAALLHLDAAALLGRLPPLDDVVGSAAGRLVDALGRANTPNERVRAAEAWCLARLSKICAPPVEVVEAARAAARGRLATVSDLAAHVGWGRRRLERAFARHVGLAPKPYVRVARIQRVLRRLEGTPAPALAALAFDQGFADQAHLTREFGRLVGCSPGRYREEQHELETALLGPTG